MCPACLTTVALIAAGASSTRGLTTLVVRTLRPNSGAYSADPQPMPHHRRVARDEWLVARKQHLSREKELTGRDEADLPTRPSGGGTTTAMMMTFRRLSDEEDIQGQLPLRQSPL